MKQFFLVFDHPILQDRMTQTIKKDQHRIQQKSDHKTNYNRCCRPGYRIQYLPKACPLLQSVMEEGRRGTAARTIQMYSFTALCLSWFITGSVVSSTWK